MFEATIRAVYEGGVFRPTEPVNLNEGDRVQLSVVKPVSVKGKISIESGTNLSRDQRMALCRLAEATTRETKQVAFNEALSLFPDEPEDEYDLISHLELNRAATGERPLHPYSREIDIP